MEYDMQVPATLPTPALPLRKVDSLFQSEASRTYTYWKFAQNIISRRNPSKYLGRTFLCVAFTSCIIMFCSHAWAATDPLSFVGRFVAAPEGSTKLSNLLGLNTHEVFDPAPLDAAKSMGLKWVRTDLFWNAAEQSYGKYDFSDWDYNFLDNLKSRGLRAVAVLGYGNSLYTGDEWNAPKSPSQTTAYANFARAAAKHFAGNGMTYELYNEPNGNQNWSTTIPAESFAQLTNKAAAAIHGVDPSAKVTAGGLQFDFEYPNAPVRYLRSVLAAGGDKNVDAVAWHAYQFGDDPETVISRFAQWNSLLKEYFPVNTPQTYQTEAGYRPEDLGGSSKAQASHLVRMILSQWAAGFKMIVVYGWEGGEGYQLRGTPAVGAIRKLTSAATGRIFVSYAIPSDPSAWHALRLDGTSNIVGVVWLRRGQKIATLPNGTVATDMFGRALSLSRISASQLSLTVNAEDGPVYLTFPK